ncbi:MAG TPA: hypothetical protein VF812_07450 [Ktedonobacterales bacterium]
MAKRKSATTERSSGDTTTRARRSDARVAQDSLPGMAASEPLKPLAEAPARASLVVSRRGGRGSALDVALRVAPSNGPRHQAHVRPGSAMEAAPEASATPTPLASAAPAEAKSVRKSGSKRFGELREALAEGWEIVQPIFARPLWSAADDSQTAFNFVLRRDQATRLLTVPGNRTVERFIATHNLKVDYRR